MSHISRVTKPKPSPDIPLEYEREITQGSDFVCLSAFSEVEGPCIEKLFPDHIIRGFNKKSYALKIMSVDLHSQQATNLFVNDSQSVIQEGLFRCYVHHSYFLDLRARGYARPLSFSFITQEPEKIMTYFDCFMDEFTHVSNILKYGNHHFFMNELEKHLNILDEQFKHTNTNNNNDDFDTSTIRTTNYVEPDDKGSSTTESFYDAESDFGNIYSDIDTGFTSESSNEDIHLPSKNQNIKKRRVSVPKVVHNSTTKSPHSLISTISDDIHDNNDKSDENVILPENENETTNESTNENESENDSNTEIQGGNNNINNIHRKNNENTTIPQRCNTDERLPDFEEDIVDIKSQKPKNTLTNRGNRSISLPVKNLDKINKHIKDTITGTLQVEDKEITPQMAIRKLRQKIKQARSFYENNGLGLNKSIGELVTTLSNSKELKNELHLKLMDKRASTKAELRGFPEICTVDIYNFAMERIDKILCNYSRKMSVLAIEREDLLISVPLSTMLAVGNCPVLNFNWENECSPYNFLNNPTEISILQKHERKTQISSPEFESFSEDDIFDSGYSFTTKGDNLLTKTESPILPIAFHRESHLPSLINDYQVFDPLYPMDLPTGCEYGRIKLESYAAGLWNQSNTYPGQGLFQLRHTYQYLPKLVYSLLTGRVVIILASPVNHLPLVRLIRALTIFIPGCWRQCLVKEWQEEPLKITDLSSAKLIGLSKETTPNIPKTIKRYITYMDIDNGMIYAPSNDSVFIEHILLPPKKFFPDETSFLAYIHTELYSISTKSSLYYQMCCLHITQPEKQSKFDTNNQKDLSTTQLKIIGNEEILKQYRTEYTTKKSDVNQFDFDLALITGLPCSLRDKSKIYFENIFKIDPSDLPIVEYFAEIIKEQQAIEMKELYWKHPILKLNDMNLTSYDNRKKTK